MAGQQLGGVQGCSMLVLINATLFHQRPRVRCSGVLYTQRSKDARQDAVCVAYQLCMLLLPGLNVNGFVQCRHSHASPGH
jgi:hypothetical protein